MNSEQNHPETRTSLLVPLVNSLSIAILNPSSANVKKPASTEKPRHLDSRLFPHLWRLPYINSSSFSACFGGCRLYRGCEFVSDLACKRWKWAHILAASACVCLCECLTSNTRRHLKDDGSIQNYCTSKLQWHETSLNCREMHRFSFIKRSHFSR